jgi:hypothetical protein
VGGSSRIPLVATVAHRRLGIAPLITEQPELVVAEGSLHVHVEPVAEVTPPPVAAPAAAPEANAAPEPEPEPESDDEHEQDEVDEDSAREPESFPTNAFAPVPGPARPWRGILVAAAIIAGLVAMVSLVPTIADALAGLGAGTGRDTGGPTTGRTTPSTVVSSRPPAWLERHSVEDASYVLTSRRSLAQRAEARVTFLDPLTGRETTVLTATTPAGATKLSVDRVTLVDTDSDTLAVFFYRVTFPESGLDPERKEHRVQVRSKATGQQVHDTAVVLGGKEWARSTWTATDVVATDPRGYVVLNYLPSGGLEDNLFHVLGLRPELTGWQVRVNCCPDSVAALAINGNVLLASYLDVDDELRGYDLVTGQLLWRHPYRLDHIVEEHPECVWGYKDSFVVRGRTVPMILKAASGAVVLNNAGYDCLTVDPLAGVGIDRGGTIVAYDLTSGAQLWTMPSEQSRALGLGIEGAYGGGLYVRTKTARLVLDVRTGKETGIQWNVAPLEWHDGWVIGFDALKKIKRVYPGNG